MTEKKYKLQIIIPHFKESWEFLSNLLDSLKMQQQINFNDFGVILVNDGNEVIFDDIFYSYPFTVDYYIKEWSGIGATRQYGLNKVSAEYVMFCDCDDLFIRLTALNEIFQLISEYSPDVITSQLVTNSIPNTFTCLNMDDFLIHGKIWKVSYLHQYSIKWDPTLKLAEDTVFVKQGLYLTENKKNILEPFYYWYRHKGSYTTVINPDSQSNYHHRLKGTRALVNKFLSLGRTELAAKYTYYQLYESYLELQKLEWSSIYTINLKRELETELALFIKDYGELIWTLEVDTQYTVVTSLNYQYAQKKKTASLINISFEDWYTSILNK